MASRIIQDSAARYVSAESSVKVVNATTPGPAKQGHIGTAIPSPEEREELERRRILAQEVQKAQVAPPGGGGAVVLPVQHFSATDHGWPEGHRRASMAKEDLKAKEGNNGGPAVLSRKDSPSFKGER